MQDLLILLECFWMLQCNGYTIVSLDKDWQTVSLVYWMVLKWR